MLRKIKWKKCSLEEIKEKWFKFIDSRNHNCGMKQSHPDFITMNDREKLINELLKRIQNA